ncbi:hypothetical protein [Pseudomonas oryzagri]|uniref:hypothetical protein n=1 Tax=Pseudomonas sp. GCM10022188 TaxID=3252651 RepID=UPI003672CBEB
MQKSEEKTAEQCLVCEGKKKKWSVAKVFSACFQAVRFFVNLFSLIDKYWPQIMSLFGFGPE